jgi:DNA-binding transcriptional MerR regulator
VALPPYQPDGSLPPLPAEEVTAKDLLGRYEVSKQTLYTRLSAIGVTGSKRGKQVFFNQEDVYRLDAAHHFLSKGYGLKDLKEACGAFDVSDEVVEVPSSAPAPGATSQMELTIAPAQERVVMALTSAVQQALQASHPAPPADPLRPYRLLKEAAEEEYQLTSQSVREILGLSQSTINSWGAEVSRNGFLLKKVGPGRWRVFREEVQQAA